MARVADAKVPEGLPDFNIFKSMAHNHHVQKGYGDLGGRLLYRGTLDPRLREIVINAISVKTGCASEWSHHVGIGRQAGMTDDELRAIRDGALGELGDTERLYIDYAHKVEDMQVTDDDVAKLRSAGLSDEQIVELTVLAGFYGMTARYLLALDVAIDEGNAGFDVP